MKRTPFPQAVLLPAAALLAAFFAAACGVSSADSVSANAVDSGGTSYDYSGRYVPVEDATGILSGAGGGYGLDHLVLFQKGTSLDGRDSKGQHWSGAISSIASGGNAHFSLSGHRNDGTAVDIVGTLSYNGGNGLMSASWIEPDNVGSVYATAAVSATTSSPSSTLSVSPSTATLARSATRTFTASGGASPYTWSLSGSGTINRTTGASVVYSAGSASGSATLTVTDGDNRSAIATITVNE